MVARPRSRLTPISRPRPIISPREPAPSPTLKKPLPHGHVCRGDIVFSSHTRMSDGDRPGFLSGLPRPSDVACVSRAAVRRPRRSRVYLWAGRRDSAKRRETALLSRVDDARHARHARHASMGSRLISFSPRSSATLGRPLAKTWPRYRARVASRAREIARGPRLHATRRLAARRPTPDRPDAATSAG